MPRVRYNVQPTGNGNWEVIKTGAQRAPNVFEKKAEAIERGRELAQAQTLGQMVIKNTKGVIQSERTYGNDPEKYPG